MRFDITRSSLFSTMLYTALLVALFWWGGSMDPAKWQGNTAMWNATWEPFEWLYVNFPTINNLLSALMVFVCSVAVSKMAISNVIFLERTYMPAVIFVLIASSFYNIENSLAILLATYCVINSTRWTLRSYVVKRLSAGMLLEGGFYMGCAVMLFPPAIYLTPMLLVGLSMFRMGSAKEWLATVVGVAMPAAMFFYGTWLLDGDLHRMWRIFYDSITMSDNTASVITHFNIVEYTFCATIITLCVLSIIKFRRNRSQYKLRSALGYGYFVIMLCWSIAVMTISPVRTLYMVPIVAFPLAVLVPNYFAASRPTFWSNFFYALLLLSAIALHLMR